MITIGMKSLIVICLIALCVASCRASVTNEVVHRRIDARGPVVEITYDLSFNLEEANRNENIYIFVLPQEQSDRLSYLRAFGPHGKHIPISPPEM